MISASHLISPIALRRYDDTGSPIYTPTEQLLLALRWFDWIEPAELYDVVGCDRGRAGDGRHAKGLERLVKSGRVERRVVSYLNVRKEPRTAIYVRLAKVQPTMPPDREPEYRPSREERMALGLCRRCDNEPEPGHSECAEHRRLNREAKMRQAHGRHRAHCPTQRKERAA